MITSKIIALFTLGYILAGCAVAPPMMESPQSSGIGISIKTSAPISLFNQNAGSVFFIRVDNKNGLFQSHVFPSNYANNGRLYLLNVEPGEYAAVTSYKHQNLGYHHASSAPVYSGSHTSVSISATTGGPQDYSTYFPKDLVEATRVKVGPGEFAFMGSFVVDQSVGLEEADKVQWHYANLLAPNTKVGAWNQLFSNDYHYRGSIKESHCDDEARNQFLVHAREDLIEGGWNTIIK